MRTVAGPSSAVQWVLTGGPYTVWSPCAACPGGVPAAPRKESYCWRRTAGRRPSWMYVGAVTAGQGGVAVIAGRRAPQCPAPPRPFSSLQCSESTGRQMISPQWHRQVVCRPHEHETVRSNVRSGRRACPRGHRLGARTNLPTAATPILRTLATAPCVKTPESASRTERLRRQKSTRHPSRMIREWSAATGERWLAVVIRFRL